MLWQASDMSVSALLGGLTFTAGDHLKSQMAFTDYYPGYGFYGQLASLSPDEVPPELCPTPPQPYTTPHHSTPHHTTPHHTTLHHTTPHHTTPHHTTPHSTFPTTPHHLTPSCHTLRCSQ